MMKKRSLLALTFCLLLTISACSPAANTPTQPPDDKAPVQTGEDPGGVPFPDHAVQIPMGTASSSGTFYIYCGGVANVINGNVKNVEVQLESTAGSGANITLLQNGEIDLMICEAGMVYEKMHGIDLQDGEQPFENIRALTPCYVNMYSIETLDQNVKTIQEFAGKDVGVGNYLSGAHLGTEKIFQALGIEANMVNSSWGDAFTDLADGRLYGVSGPTGHPSSPILELETKAAVNYVPLQESDIQTVLDRYGYNFSKATIPAGTYNSMTEDYNTVGVWVCLYVRDDMDDNLAYHLTKAIMGNNDTMVATHALGVYSTPENIVNQSVPIHAGAMKYYQEIGIDIPADLIPS